MAAPHPPPARTARALVIMGVSGSGKTTVGERLAAELGWGFRDADDFHPPQNVAKMSAGQPLDDRDRAPWLAAIRAHLDTALARGESTIVTCSALKERYRDVLVGDPARVTLVHLTGDFALIRARMERRTDHFFKAELLRSQFEALEPPADAIAVDIAQPPEAIVAEIRQRLGL